MDSVKERFGAVYGGPEVPRAFFAPGRVNLIGEYTDYNGGHVLPCALAIGTYGAASARTDRMVRLWSENFSNLGILTVDLDDLTFQEHHRWANYVKGILWAFEAQGTPVPFGFDAVISGNIPNGAGLSSSASLELLTSVIVNNLFGLGLTMESMVQLSKRAENEYIGVQCGIMDQFAIGMCQKGHAVLLNTESMHYEHVPLTLEGHELVIANSNKRRGLADSKYNIRFEECREALKDLQTVTDIRSLGDLDEAAFAKYGSAIRNPDGYRRARHAVLENRRTLKAVEALRNGDMKAFGQYMNASHESLQKDYAVTGVELDTLVELAQAHPGVLGSRMTGAGFGGCTVSLVESSRVKEFIQNVGAGYRERIGYDADFYVVQSGPGACELTK